MAERSGIPADDGPTALVLAGGGSFGAVQVGMLRALVADGLAPDLIVGSSVGAINGAWFAGAPNADGVARLEAIWRGLHRREIFPMGLRNLLGLVSVVAPLIITGNTVVVIASEEHPLTAMTLGEVMATSDLPGGVVNVLTGSVAEVAPWLASHMDVNGIDLTGVTDEELATELEVAAADNLKRVRRPAPDTDWLAEPDLDRMTRFLETKTVWHPIGV